MRVQKRYEAQYEVAIVVIREIERERESTFKGY